MYSLERAVSCARAYFASNHRGRLAIMCDAGDAYIAIPAPTDDTAAQQNDTVLSIDKWTGRAKAIQLPDPNLTASVLGSDIVYRNEQVSAPKKCARSIAKVPSMKKQPMR